MNFKFFQGKNNMFLELEPTQLLTLTRHRFNPENVEFCFQFGDDEPVVFATGPNECSIHLNPTTDANIAFNNNGKEFKLFAREIRND
jgi:hypothetical protein